jgi:hypothetical protein
VQSFFMPLTEEQIFAEVKQWPLDRLTQLLDRLAGAMHSVDIDADELWKRETRSRLAEIEQGLVAGVPGQQVSDRIRGIVGR